MAEFNDDGAKTLEAKCYCGSVHFTIDVPISSLPLPVHLCHCSMCRYNSGAPCVFHARLPSHVKPQFVGQSSEESIKTYVTSAPSNWTFCSTCGCHIASVDATDGRWMVVSSSIFTDHRPENFQLKKHIFSKSTKDGGLKTMLTHVGGRELLDWNPPDDDPSAKLVECHLQVGTNGEERLRAECRCGGVSFSIGRPTREVLGDDFARGFVSPLDPAKWMATWDVCNDCRLVDGTHVVGWTFVPLVLCEPAISSDFKIGTCMTYPSSPGVLRSFCGTCGATVFYSSDKRDPSDGLQVVDVATGILRAPEGAMAEKWLTWRSRIANLEVGKEFDHDFAHALSAGTKEWVVARCGQELTMDLGC